MITDPEIVAVMLAAWDGSDVTDLDEVSMQVVLDVARSMDWPRVSAGYVSRYVDGMRDGYAIARQDHVDGSGAVLEQRCADAKAGVYLVDVRKATP